MSTTVYTFRVTGMHCGSCALLVDDTLEDLPGVHHSRTSSKDGRSIVELDTTLSTTDAVVAAIDELGYQAVPVATTEDHERPGTSGQ
jgi:copper chaperone